MDLSNCKGEHRFHIREPQLLLLLLVITRAGFLFSSLRSIIFASVTFSCIFFTILSQH
jgi:hypothetical protein